jgi:hypothetical protein
MITRKRKEPSDLDQPIFSQPTAQIFEDVDNEAGGGKSEDEDKRFEELGKQIAELQRVNDEMQRANMALLASPTGWKSQAIDAQLEDPNKVELPDPALDPQGYDKATGERQRIRNENHDRQRRAEEAKDRLAKERADELVNAFSEKYPALANDEDHEERLNFVSLAIVKAAQKRGVDVERYMFVTQDKFLDDVAKKYVKVFGEPEEDDDDFVEEPRARKRASSSSDRGNNSRRRRRSEDDDMVSRTSGIFGGTEGGGRPSRNKGDDENGPDMIDDIQALQRKTGFY